MSSKIPRGGPLPAEMKKLGHKADVKDAASSATNKDGVLKAQRENAPRKNAAGKVYKGVSTRYDLQAELKEQNLNLTAANEELQRNLTETRQRVAELELHFGELEKENSEAQKNLKNCHVMLVAAKLDPREVLGEAAQRNEEQRREVMSVSTDLLSELKAFSDVASQQRSQLQEIQTKMMQLTEAREQMMQERQNFALDAAEMEKALEEAEVLLM